MPILAFFTMGVLLAAHIGRTPNAVKPGGTGAADRLKGRPASSGFQEITFQEMKSRSRKSRHDLGRRLAEHPCSRLGFPATGKRNSRFILFPVDPFGIPETTSPKNP
ncbi:hypothetical protein [Blastochloris sulfoviridis]|uniref:Uncharacterized protein n=1 Tax=Blastochloris sulfoviridis TaxID=50712 RepID=A0A5M6I0M3_9HYPH|nr:hypothetical protein [Blastochloris sulfoviridis]KAA5601716.1 hypothetical protein F1193_09375 [Blastochloris sulfoviridis]